MRAHHRRYVIIYAIDGRPCGMTSGKDERPCDMASRDVPASVDKVELLIALGLNIQLSNPKIVSLRDAEVEFHARGQKCGNIH